MAGFPANPYSGNYDGPSSYLGLDPSLQQVLTGQAQSYLPTQDQFYTRNLQSVRNNQFMMDSVKSDPRGSAVTDFVMRQAFNNDQKRLNSFYSAIGGQDNLRSGAGMIINMPGISGFMGGDIRSISAGSLAAAGSGASIQGKSSYGTGFVQDAMARQLHDSIMSKFFTASGGNRLNQTSGLNMDQLGGIMTIGASQGAFKGMDLGSVSSMNGTVMARMNESTGEDIKNFIKTAAKSMSTLVDVFGSQDMQTLATMAQKITGLDLSSMRNVNAMHERLSKVTTIAAGLGVDSRTAFDQVSAGRDRKSVV